MQYSKKINFPVTELCSIKDYSLCEISLRDGTKLPITVPNQFIKHDGDTALLSATYRYGKIVFDYSTSIFTNAENLLSKEECEARAEQDWKISQTSIL